MRGTGELADFDRAIRQGKIALAWHLAKSISALPLDRALSLTVLAGERSDPRFEAASQRFIGLVLEESAAGRLKLKAPGNLQLKKLLNCFIYFDHPFYGPFARDGLEGLHRQLREEAPADIDFDQVEEP